MDTRYSSLSGWDRRSLHSKLAMALKRVGRAALFAAMFALPMGCQTPPAPEPTPAAHIRSRQSAPPAALLQESIEDMRPVVEIAECLAGVHGGKGQVLVPYDIDNTLLAPTTQLGSDQWFDWQSRARYAMNPLT
jgi:hypothetical protein